MHFCRSCFSNMVSFRYILLFLNLFCFCFMCNKYYLMLLSFRRYLFSVNAICLIDEKHTQWNMDTKVKVFHESILFHETSLKLYFMKCSERKNSQFILAFRNIHISLLNNLFISILNLFISLIELKNIQ